MPLPLALSFTVAGVEDFGLDFESEVLPTDFLFSLVFFGSTDCDLEEDFDCFSFASKAASRSGQFRF